LSGGHLKVDQDTLRCLEVLRFFSGFKIETLQDFVNNCDAVDLITQDVSENVVVRRKEQRVDNLLGSFWLGLLVDYTKNGKGCEFMRAEVGKVGGETRSQKTITGMEARCIK